jgi:hypothetical protein
VVEFEEPAIELESRNLQEEEVSNLKKLDDLEASILQGLENAQGSILDNEELLTTLSESKEMSTRISKRQREAKETAKTVELKRLSYSKIADVVSSIFFDICALSDLSYMYNFSLEWYLDVFGTVLQETETPPVETTSNRYAGVVEPGVKLQLFENINDNFKHRQQNLCVNLFKALWVDISRSLSPEHTLVFSFSLAMKLLIVNNSICQSDLNALLELSSEGLTDAFDATENSDTRDGSIVFTPEIDRKIKSISKNYPHHAWLQNLVGICRESQMYASKFQDSILESDAPLKGIRKLVVEEKPSIIHFIALVLMKNLRPEKFVDSVTSAVEGVRGVMGLSPCTFWHHHPHFCRRTPSNRIQRMYP